jgi:hypothetical protein|tara:strand:- start:317 stop:1036 length:720 start_codon:yes stop_codon:yes gene_type:complete
MTTYIELVSQIREYTETNDNVLTTTIVDDFIEHTENKILRELNIPAFVSHQYANFTASNPFLSLPGGAGPTPVLFATINSMMIYSAGGTGDRTFLLRKDVSFMNEYWPDRTTTGTPKYYSQWDDNTVYVVPTPDAAYTVEMSMSKLPDRLTSSTTSTWLSNNAPTLLLYGCLIEAFKYLKGPAEMLQVYQQSYATALQEVAAQYMGMGKRDAYKAGVIRIPRPSFQPGLGSIKPTQGGQ